MKSFAAVLILLVVPFDQAQDKMQADKPMAHPAAATSTFKAQVQERADAWKAAFQAKDADKVAAMYMDDAVWINPEGTFHASSEIKGELKKMLDRGDTVESINTTKAIHFGELGYAEGTYTGTAPGKDGKQQSASGSWVVTLKGNNGKWMLATHTSVPTVAAATAKSAKKSE